ncbi:MAG: PmoA family protein [Akkermansiaceae bacterium]
MMMRSLVFLFSSSVLVSAQFSIQSVDGAITIRKEKEVVTQYRTDSKVPYLYPISAPGGTNLSRHWPMDEDAVGEERDHPHHRSLWLSHGAVNGYDFWAWTGNKDARIVHESTSDATAQGNQAKFSVKLSWQGDKKTILEETRKYSIEDIDETTRVIDVTATLKATAGDVVFGDTKEGFFAFRVDRTLRFKGPTAKGGILDNHGRKDVDCWGKKSAYVTFHGPDDQGKPAVITMMDHPGNLRHETWWHARDYGLLAANPFGIHDFEGKKDKTLGNYTLKDQETLTFRYRLVLHRGQVDESKIAGWWKSFSN